MRRKGLAWLIGALFLLVSATAHAGGPPYLCMPIDRVTAANVKTATELLNVKLKDKLWPYADELRGLNIVEQDVSGGAGRQAKQWYVAFYMGKDVRLSDIQNALKG